MPGSVIVASVGSGPRFPYTDVATNPDMLLMVATSRHHGMPALPDPKDGLQGALFILWTPDAKHRHHQPNTTHLDPPPLEALVVARDLSS